MPIAGLIGFVGVGLALGLLGGGGGILAVPVLVYLMGFSPKVAAVMSLVVVGLTAAFGAWTRWRKGLLRFRTVALFAAGSVTMAYIAPRLGTDLPDRWRIALSIATMLLAALAMWHRSRRVPAIAADPDVANLTAPSAALIVPAALTTGTLTGLIGVGGGFLIVPVLTGVLNVPMAEATATSLAVIVLNTVAAGIAYQGQVVLDPAILAQVLAAALVGMIVGTRMAPRFSARTLTRGFAFLLVAVSGVMAWQEIAKWSQ